MSVFNPPESSQAKNHGASFTLSWFSILDQLKSKAKNKRNLRFVVKNFLSFPNKLFVFRIFDEGDDGHIFAADLVEVLTNLGDRLTKSEARKLVQNADITGEGRIDYIGSFCKERPNVL